VVSRFFTSQQLLQALTTAGVPVSLTSHPSFGGVNALDVALYAFNPTTGTFQTVNQPTVAGNQGLDVVPYGSTGSPLVQDNVFKDLYINYRVGGTVTELRQTGEGLSDTVQAGSRVVAPAAGATIVTITPGVAGTYIVRPNGGVHGGTNTPDAGNTNLNKNAVLIAALPNGADSTDPLGQFRVTVTSADTLNITAILAGSAAGIYTFLLVAVKVP